MSHYIVRIYRRNDQGRPLAGIVEIVGDASTQYPFRTAEELWEILSCSSTAAPSKAV